MTHRQVGELVYNIVPLKTISPLTSLLSFKCEDGKWFTEKINEVVRCEKMIKPLLERLQSEIFRRQMKVVIGLGATMHELMEI